MGEEFVPSEISFIVESIEIQPNPVPPGGDFALKVKCLVADPDVKESKVALQFTYKILKDEEVVRKKTNRLSVPHGKTATLKNNLVAGRTAGTYKIQIILYYKDKIAGKSANLVIGGKL